MQDNETIAASRPTLTNSQNAQLSEFVHPVVRTVEDTGEQALFINPGFTFRIDGIAGEEVDELLAELFGHSTRPEFICVHKWWPRDLLCWDNRSVMHHANLYKPTQTRHMHRITIRGARPT